MYYNGKIINVSINYEEFKNKGTDPLYLEEMKEEGFKDLMQCVALCTKASFSYKPSIDEIKAYVEK